MQSVHVKEAAVSEHRVGLPHCRRYGHSRPDSVYPWTSKSLWAIITAPDSSALHQTLEGSALELQPQPAAVAGILGFLSQLKKWWLSG